MDIGRRVREAHRRREEAQEETAKINQSEQTEPSSPVTQQQETPAPANTGGIDWKKLIAANFGNPDEVIKPGESASRAFYRLRAEKPKNQTPEVFSPTSNVLVSAPTVPGRSSRARVIHIGGWKQEDKKPVNTSPPKSTLTDALKPKEETSNSQAKPASEPIGSVAVLIPTSPSQDQPTVTTTEGNDSSVTDLTESTLDAVATSTTKPGISPVAMGLFGNSNSVPSVESSPSQPSTAIGKTGAQANSEAKQSGSLAHSTHVNTASDNSPKHGKEDHPKLPPDNSWFNVFKF